MFSRTAKARGAALLMVLILVTVISIIVLLIQRKNAANIGLAFQAKNYLQAQIAVQNLTEEMLFLFKTTPLWLNGGNAELLAQQQLPPTLNFHGQTFLWQNIEVRITDASGLIAVLPFNAMAWRKLLQYHQVKQTDQIVAALEDWSDEDDFLHLNGAESRMYRLELQRNDLPRNYAPQTLQELQLLKGMTPEIWQKISPYLIYIGQEEQNPEYIPQGLLEMAVGESMAKDMIEQRSGGAKAQGFLKQTTTEDLTFAPTNRLRIELSAKIDTATYKESFTLVRVIGNPKLIYVADRRPGDPSAVLN